MKKLFIFAGPNGSGKSTFYVNKLKEGEDFGIRINSDEIAKDLGSWNNNEIQMLAAKIAIKRRNSLISSNKDFNIETTLSGKSIGNFIKKAKEAGYYITLYYIGIKTSDLSYERVKSRMSKLGHGVEEEVVKRRFDDSFKNLDEIKNLCNEYYIFDNSPTIEGEINQALCKPNLVAQKVENELKIYDESSWIMEKIDIKNHADSDIDLDLALESVVKGGLRPPRNFREDEFQSTMLSEWVSGIEYLNTMLETPIKYVPYEEVGEILINELEYPDSPSRKTIDKLNEELEEGYMLRFDTNSGIGLKKAMQEGKTKLEKSDLILDIEKDERSYSIMLDSPYSNNRIYKRPIIEAMKIKNSAGVEYPVEFRFFMVKNNLEGISFYYPQVDNVKMNEQILEWLNKALMSTRAISYLIEKSGRTPVHITRMKKVEDIDKGRGDYTLDFMVDKNGDVLFLEAGPGSPSAAHPCCFFNPKTKKLSDIKGIKLSVEGEVYDLNLLYDYQDAKLKKESDFSKADERVNKKDELGIK